MRTCVLSSNADHTLLGRYTSVHLTPINPPTPIPKTNHTGLPPTDDAGDGADGAGEGVFEGRVLIARHPIHDPAHMRAFQAVRAPPLRAFLGDRAGVLFFSTQGPRSPASLLSNGDLDGDVYFVCMNRALVAAARPVGCVTPLSMLCTWSSSPIK